MSIFIDIALSLISYSPKLFSWWLYKPERTMKHISVDVSAQEGSVEIWCDKKQAHFSIIIDFRNNNPFVIEIDRAEASASLHTAKLKASNFFGIKVDKGKIELLRLEGIIDDHNLKYVNESPDGEHLRVELKAIVMNKYHTMRNFNKHFDRLMCKLINKKVEQAD